MKQRSEQTFVLTKHDLQTSLLGAELGNTHGSEIEVEVCEDLVVA